MNFFKKLIFILSLSALQLSVKIEAQIAGCGGTYTSLSGTISSPNYPSNYSDNLNCSYFIQLSPANSVNITFISFDTEPCCDYLQVSCLSDSSKAVPKFYGTNAPPFLSINPCYSVRLLFFTDGSVVRPGFSLRYDIGNGLQGGLTMKPMNAYGRNNSPEPIVLSCSSRANHPDAYPWWSFSTDGYSFRIVTAQNCSVFSSILYSSPAYFNTSRQYSPRTCNLTISPSFVTSAIGFYTCADATLDIASALVIYLTTSFTGSLLSSATTEVVQNDQFTFGCSARVQAIYPYLQIIPSIYIYSVEDRRLIFSSNTTASITISASPESLPSYACDINYTLAGYFPPRYPANMPEKTSLVTPSRQVLYWPEDEAMLIQGDYNGRILDNGNLSCFVPANPPATYRWTKETFGGQWVGPTLAVSNNGTYTCTANNIIRGSTYSASKSITITVIRSAMDNGQQNTPMNNDQRTSPKNNDQQTSPRYWPTEKTEPDNKLNSVALIVGVVLGAAVLLLLILTIVAFVCPCRKKNSSTDHPVRRTNEIGQDNNVYRMTRCDTLYANSAEVGIHLPPDTRDDQSNGYEELRKGWTRS